VSMLMARMLGGDAVDNAGGSCLVWMTRLPRVDVDNASGSSRVGRRGCQGSMLMMPMALVLCLE